MSNIQDFGEKIGGARKDMWAGRGLNLPDIEDMTVTERRELITKDNIWPKPDWEKLIEEGTPRTLAYWQNKMRAAVPPKPSNTTKESQDNYVSVISRLKEDVMSLEEDWEINYFYNEYFKKAFVADTCGRYVNLTDESKDIFTNKVLRVAQAKRDKMEREAEDKMFGIPKNKQVYVKIKNNMHVYKYDGEYNRITPDGMNPERWNVLTVHGASSFSTYFLDKQTSEFFDISKWEKDKFFIIDDRKNRPIKINFDSREEAEKFIETYAQEEQEKENNSKSKNRGDSKNGRKKAFVPPQLKNIKRDGPDYRHMKHTDGKSFMDDLKFRAGEFGNWLNDEDRQSSLDMAYDGLRDLARVLHIRPEDVSLNGTLALAFGARGRGGANAASAHYEPARQVINLTKMSGAGCLAHEWGHALDHAIGLKYGYPNLATENTRKDMPQALLDVLDAMKYKKVTVKSADLAKEMMSKAENSERQLKAWVNSVRPTKMVESLEEAWNNAIEELIKNVDSFNGSEYFAYRRGDAVITRPEVELLSAIRKEATNHGIPRDTKHQIALWANCLKGELKEVKNAAPQERVIKTDFYNGSGEFDKIFSRAGHGYWQSTCEMFARAFDCYVVDKLKEEGLRSDYLSARADSFVITNKNDSKIAAIPLDDERKVINEKMDLLIEDLKSRGILHEYVEEIQKSEPENLSVNSEKCSRPEFEWPRNFEQLSFDDLLSSAQKRTCAAPTTRNHSKEEPQR